MKKIIALLALTLLLSSRGDGQPESKAQDPHGVVDFGSGLDVQYMLPVLALSGGYSFRRVVVQGIVQASISGVEFKNTLFGISAGYDFHNIVPAVDFYYNNVNNSDKSRNGFSPGYSLTYNANVMKRGGIFIRALHIRQTNQILIGFHAVIGSLKRNR